MYVDFNDIPDSGKIWIYQSEHELSNEEAVSLSAALNTFVNNWQAHGADLNASYRILYNRFIIIGVDEEHNKATGCSIDDSVRLIQSVQEELGINLLDRINITYKDEEGNIKSVSKKEFKEMLENGELNKDTIVFNNMITKLGEFEKYWEVPAHESWHARMLPNNV